MVVPTLDGDPRSARAIVVGDDERRLMAHVLASSPHEVVSVDSVDDAVHEIKQRDDDVVVVSAVRSPAEGLAVARTLRADEATANAPVLLVVAHPGDDPGTLEEVLRLGAVDVVPRTTDGLMLRAKVDLLGDLARKGRALRHTTALVDDHVRTLVAQQELMQSLSRGGDDDVMAHLARSLARGLGWQAGAYWMADGDGFRCAESWVDPAVPPADADILRAGLQPGRVSAALDHAGARSAEPIPLDALDGDDPGVRAARDAGMTETMVLPIADDTTLFGVVELLGAPDRPAVDPRTAATLDALAAVIARFAQARRTEHETETLKNEFFALVSHELLTPLTSILGYLEELLAGASGEFNEDQLMDLEVIDRNARRLFRLVDDLMFVAQVETGQLSLDLMDVDLGAVVVEAIEAAQPAAKGRGVRIVSDIEPVDHVRGDVRRLGQVADHLISNAIKFSHDGGRVEVVLRRDGDRAVLAVVDEGVGVPDADKPQVFERFTRSSITAEQEIPGIGLGLPITKVIAEAHGGSIWMESAEGEGSTFSVALPLDAGRGGNRSDDDQE